MGRRALEGQEGQKGTIGALEEPDGQKGTIGALDGQKGTIRVLKGAPKGHQTGRRGL